MTSTASTTAVIGIKMWNAANPNAGNSASRICSLPYAEDEMQSEDKIPKAKRLLSRWCESEWRLSGLPRKAFLIL